MRRPKYVTDEHLEYLEDLRKSAITNMYGAVPYLMDSFGLDKKTARNILTYWMKEYGHFSR